MKREPLPSGKITIRHRQMRNVFQAFAGRVYLDGCSGGYPEDAAREMCRFYEIPDGTEATVYGLKNPFKIDISTHQTL